MESEFLELILFQVKPDKVNEFEALARTMKVEQAKQQGCISIHYMKRFYTFDGIEKGNVPRELTKIVKCVKYYSYWEFDHIDNCGRANGWFFDNYEKAIQKLLIMPFDINSGYLL